MGIGWPTIPMFPVWSITTRANEPLGSPRVCQNGTVIEQSGVPALGPASHSVIHSSARNFCPSAAHAKAGVWAHEARSRIAAIRHRQLRIPNASSGRSTRSNIPDRAQFDKLGHCGFDMRAPCCDRSCAVTRGAMHPKVALQHSHRPSGTEITCVHLFLNVLERLRAHFLNVFEMSADFTMF